jgi:hypothetical protein
MPNNQHMQQTAPTTEQRNASYRGRLWGSCRRLWGSSSHHHLLQRAQHNKQQGVQNQHMQQTAPATEQRNASYRGRLWGSCRRLWGSSSHHHLLHNKQQGVQNQHMQH